MRQIFRISESIRYLKFFSEFLILDQIFWKHCQNIWYFFQIFWYFFRKSDGKFWQWMLLKIDSEALETQWSDLPQNCHLQCALTGDWMKKLLNAAAIVTKSVQARQYLAEKCEKSLDNTTSRVATQAKCRFHDLHCQPSAGSAWNLRRCFGSLADGGLHEKICIQASFWTKTHTDTCARPTLITTVGFANGTRC